MRAVRLLERDRGEVLGQRVRLGAALVIQRDVQVALYAAVEVAAISWLLVSQLTSPSVRDGTRISGEY